MNRNGDGGKVTWAVSANHAFLSKDFVPSLLETCQETSVTLWGTCSPHVAAWAAMCPPETTHVDIVEASWAWRVYFAAMELILLTMLLHIASPKPKLN